MDPFASFFGDFGFNFGNQDQRNEVHKGANIVMDLYASLEEMYTGNFVEVIVVRDVSQRIFWGSDFLSNMFADNQK